MAQEKMRQAAKSEQSSKRHFELNLDPAYWRTKFLYPFALDPAPLRLDAAAKQKPEEVIQEKKR